MEKQSFLSNLIGKTNYHGFKEEYALVIFFIGTGLLAILTPLTFFCYWGILSSFLNLITGTSLLFIVYVAALIVLLDKEVKVETHSDSTIAKQKVKEAVYLLADNCMGTIPCCRWNCCYLWHE